MCHSKRLAPTHSADTVVNEVYSEEQNSTVHRGSLKRDNAEGKGHHQQWKICYVKKRAAADL